MTIRVYQPKRSMLDGQTESHLVVQAGTYQTLRSRGRSHGVGAHVDAATSGTATAGLIAGERRTMTAEQPESQAMGVHSLEVRWIFPGLLETGMTEWFGRFAAVTESREDTYLLDPSLPGLSVKIRGGGPLEVKVYRGSPGILNVAGRARGRLESWQKWSFPAGPPGQASAERAGWRLVRKRRRISRFPPMGWRGLGEELGCAVELTEVRMRGEVWWTLGFEATGPASVLRRELEATAALVFADILPGGVELGTDDSRSYAEWLCQRRG